MTVSGCGMERNGFQIQIDFDNKEPTQSQFQQIQNNQVAQPGYDQNSQMLLIQQTKKSNNGLWISLVIIDQLFYSHLRLS